jgi:hypothetical protein
MSKRKKQHGKKLNNLKRNMEYQNFVIQVQENFLVDRKKKNSY